MARRDDGACIPRRTVEGEFMDVLCLAHQQYRRGTEVQIRERPQESSSCRRYQACIAGMLGPQVIRL